MNLIKISPNIAPLHASRDGELFIFKIEIRIFNLFFGTLINVIIVCNALKKRLDFLPYLIPLLVRNIIALFCIWLDSGNHTLNVIIIPEEKTSSGCTAFCFLFLLSII